MDSIKTDTQFQGFATSQIFYSDNPRLLNKIKIDELFYLDYRYDPSYMNWVNKKGESTLLYSKPEKDDIKKMKANGYSRAFELIIFAKNEEFAENINNLIYGGRLLAYPSVYEMQYSNYIIELDNDFILEKFYRKRSISKTMLLSSLIAKQAIEEDIVYSIEKYRFSLELDSITPHSGNPSYGEIFYASERDYSYHVHSGTAIFTAASIIEELKLDIRSSSRNPRFIKNNTEWNQKVKNNLLKRLENVNITENETINWIVRDKPNALYNKIKPKLNIINSKWYNGVDVLDKELYIIDAIHFSSYIRNYFIAHKYNKVVKYINPYDVHNIQTLARRLILAKLDLWKVLEKDAVTILHNM